MHPAPTITTPAGPSGPSELPRGAIDHADSLESHRTLQCLEVWGGNGATHTSVAVPGLDAWIYAKPYQSATGGGDIHYISSCGTGRIARLLVADVSGHGAEVAPIAVKLRDLMRRFVNYLDQTQFVARMNREFVDSTDAGIFATAVVGTYWAPTRYLVTSNAGHPPPLRYRAATRSWERLEPEDRPAAGGPSNLPLGILEPTRYDQFGVRLGEGDLVLIYTDSLIETPSADGAMLGPSGLLSMLGALDAGRPQDLIPALLRRLSEHQSSDTFGDDVTILLLRNTESDRVQSPLRERLHAAWVFAGILVSKLWGSKTPIPWPEFSLANLAGAIFSKFNQRWGGRARG